MISWNTHQMKMNYLSSVMRFLSISFILLVTGCAEVKPQVKSSHAQELNHGFIAKQESAEDWWNIPYPVSFDAGSLTKKQSRISVRGNHFVTAEGDRFLFRGVNIADPFKLAHQGHWNKGLFEEIGRWGANTVRIPIHPLGWRKRGQDWYFARLDEAVRWANEQNIYLIIDWHSIGNLEAELFQHPMYETTFSETRQFWRSMALHYKNVPTVAVYELFNEPTHNYIGVGPESLGKASWTTWRNKLEELIDLIYTYDSTVIPLVAGYNWAYDLSPIAREPVRRPGIAYAAHPYPEKAKPNPPTRENFFKLWEQTWGYVADSAPIIATELGWVNSGGYGAHAPVVHDDRTYGPNIVEYMKRKGVSYTVWIFDPDWPPRMIEDWNFTPSEQGAFFKEVMIRDNK
jgi:endoglucanase